MVREILVNRLRPLDQIPRPERVEPIIPEWKEPDYPAHRDFPHEPFRPAIYPTEPWPDPEPPAEPPKK